MPTGCLHNWTWTVGSGQGPAEPGWVIPGPLVGAFPMLCDPGCTVHWLSYVNLDQGKHRREKSGAQRQMSEGTFPSLLCSHHKGDRQVP